MRLRSILTTLLALLAFAAQAENRSLRHDGVERDYRIEKPSGTATPLPLLIVLHGGGGNAEQVRRYTGFRLSRAGWAVAYPDGRSRGWNDGRMTEAGALVRTGDDAGFLLSVIDDLTRRGEADPERVFLAGISNGGAMAIRMACTHPRRVAGIASIAMTVPEGLPCPPRRPVPALFILGDADPLVPYEGGPITAGWRDRGRVHPALLSFDMFARANRCRGREIELLPDRDPRDGIRVERVTGHGCAAPLIMLTAQGGGHTWPGAAAGARMTRVLGPTARDVSATAEIERFFRALARD